MHLSQLRQIVIPRSASLVELSSLTFVIIFFLRDMFSLIFPFCESCYLTHFLEFLPFETEFKWVVFWHYLYSKRSNRLASPKHLCLKKSLIEICVFSVWLFLCSWVTSVGASLFCTSMACVFCPKQQKHGFLLSLTCLLCCWNAKDLMLNLSAKYLVGFFGGSGD